MGNPSLPRLFDRAERAPFEPVVSPGSGWHRTPGYSMPYSDADNDARAKAAWPCWVLLLRLRGVRLPAWQLVEQAPISGEIVGEQHGDHWSINLYANARSRLPVMVGDRALMLMRIDRLRDNAGVRLYSGVERIGTRLEYRQSWLCAQEPQRLRAIALDMLSREGTAPQA